MRAFFSGLGLPPRALAMLCLISLLSFSIETITASSFSSSGAFDHYNVLFDADSSEGLAIRAHGWSEDGRANVKVPNYQHPLINYMTMPAIRAVAKPLAPVMGSGTDTQSQVREKLALLVSPACLSLAALAVGVTLLLLGLSTGAAIAAASLYAFSFSSLVFGAVPDHFAMGGLSITLLFAWLAFWLVRPDPISRFGYCAWALLVVFAVSVTVTHSAVAFVVLALALIRREPIVAGLVRSALASLVVVVGVVLCAAILGQLLAVSGIGPRKAATNITLTGEVGTIRKYAGFSLDSIASKGADFGLHSVQAVIGLGIERHPAFNTGEPDMIAPLSRDAWLPIDDGIGLFFAALLVFGLYRGLRPQANYQIRSFSLACALILVTNIVLHSVYGRIMFLFSQHWLPPMLFFLVLAFNGALSRLGQLPRAAIAFVLVSGISLSNLYWLEKTTAMAKKIMIDHRHAGR